MAAPIKLKPATFDPVAKARDEFGWPADDPRIATLERIRTPAQRLALWLEMMDKLLVGAATAEDQAALGYLMLFMNQDALLISGEFTPAPDYSLVDELTQAIKARAAWLARFSADTSRVAWADDGGIPQDRKTILTARKRLGIARAPGRPKKK